ncbi:uncharacterized protein [Rutidosis leptorrhynchoides]|uniref:uncharacterized protein n=1 Tax=Rutidosis leptorrhynchoides TaxID=125765 RepID=UPI003A99B421
MQIYWTSVYVLPNGVIDDIEKCHKGFLWCQAESSKGRAKVAWENVCLPKDQGGLGLKPLKDWNEALLVKHIWRILTQKDSLWGKWVNIVKLNGGSLWEASAGCSDSNGWKFFMELKEKVKRQISVEYRNGRDDYKWITNDGKKVNFSTVQVWLDFRINRNLVGWHHVVWFRYMEPKHAFILWLVMLNRLNTQDRIQKWLPNQVLKCSLCEKVSDYVEHLFFKCDYSMEVWCSLKSKLVFKGLQNQVKDTVQALAQYPYSNNIWCILNRAVLAAFIYFIWHERNDRVFKKKKRSAAEIVSCIQKHVRMKMHVLKVKNSNAVLRAASMWKLKWQDFKFVLY